MVSVPQGVAKALPASATVISCKSLGGSALSDTLRIGTEENGKKRDYFCKVVGNKSAEKTMKGEFTSLQAIYKAVPGFCPEPIAMGRESDDGSGKFFMLSGWLNPKGSGSDLGSNLAKLHSATSDNGKFGFDVQTFCGATPLDNTWTSKWSEFFVERRMKPILQLNLDNNGTDPELTQVVNDVCDKVVPKLLGKLDDQIKPALIHGDLWSGNASGDQIFDPSSCYTHNEFEIGIMKMFGGFSTALNEYHKIFPKTEPANEYADRINLYQSYHELNHAGLFGGGSYRSSAMRNLKSLLKKYG